MRRTGERRRQLPRPKSRCRCAPNCSRQLGELQHRAQECLSRRIERTRERFELTVCRWPQPQAIFAPMVQRLDDVGERLPRSLASRAGSARADLNLVAGRLAATFSTSVSCGWPSGWAPLEDGRTRPSRAAAVEAAMSE